MSFNFWKKHKDENDEIATSKLDPQGFEETTYRQFSILALGGTGCKIGSEICMKRWPNIDRNIGRDTDDIDIAKIKEKYEKCGGEIKRLKYTEQLETTDEKIIGRLGEPAARNFLIGEWKMANSFDVKVMEELIQGMLGGEHFTFLLSSAGGGTGHGFLRAISKKVRNLGGTIPLVIFPKLYNRPDTKLNSYAAYGFLINKFDNFGAVAFIDNNNFGDIISKYNENKINSHISRCVATMTESAGYGQKEIGIRGAIKTLKFKTFTLGFGSALYIPDGIKSTSTAIKFAYDHLFCDFDEAFHEDNDKNKTGIVFAIIPYRADICSIRDAIQQFSENEKIEIGEGLFIAHADTYTVDIVLLIAGKIRPKILDERKKLSYEFEGRINDLISDLRQIEVPESEIDRLYKDAREDFEKGFGNGN